jgi:signal transduction histidine kinase
MQYSAIIPLLACAGFVVLIALVVRENWRIRVNQLFIWYTFLLAAWAFGAFMVYANFAGVDPYFWNSALIVFPVIAFVAFYHFVRVFIHKPVPWLWIGIGYGLCFLFIIAAALGFVVESAYWSDGAYHLELGIATYIMMPVMPFFIGAALFELIQAYRKEKQPYNRNRIAYTLAGFSVALLLSSSNMLPEWKWYPVDQLGNLINASLLTYAVLRYKLLDINVVFRGGVRYAIQSIIIAGVLLLVGVAYFAAGDTIDSVNWGLAVGVAIILAIIFQLLIRWMRRPVGGLFAAERIDYRDMLRSTSHALGAMPELEDQASWLVDNMMSTVDTVKGSLFLLDRQQKRYIPQVLRGYSNSAMSQLYLDSDNPAVALMARLDRCLVAEDLELQPQLRAMWELEREQLAEVETRVLVPVKVKDGLIGIILLGPKRSQRVYSVDDLEFLYSVANQAAVAIENTRLYREVRDRANWINMISGLTKTIGSSLDLNQVYETFTAALKRLVDFDRISIGLIEGDKLRFLTVSSDVPKELDKGDTIPLKKSVAAWVIAHGTTNIENDFDQERQFPVDETHLRDGLRSAIRVPLFSKGEVFGTLNLTSCRPNAYGERERKILEQIAGQLAVAIQNSLLYDESKRAYEDARQAYDELSVAQEYMVRSEKLRALGEMAGGVAHDFNNVLSVILGRAQLALDGVEDPMLKKSLQAIEQAALDAASTVRRLQEFTRVRTDQDFVPVDVSHLVKSALQMTEPRLKEGSEKDGVRVEVSTELNAVNSVRGDVAELREALINMIFNAVDAMPEGGKIMIKTWQEDNQLVLSVADTGVGMPDEIKAKVFDPFFTTKGPSGMGLGLSVAYGIITRHGGNIDVESSPGNGSTFYINLPIGGEKVNSQSSSDDPPPTGKGKILMVDDDPAVREILEMMLLKIGYEVTAVSHGQEAIDLFEQGDYDCVIADLGMPDVSGWDVAEAVKRKSPQTPVVLITGWGVQIDREQMERSGINGVIAKPVTKQTLFDELERLLESDK